MESTTLAESPVEFYIGRECDPATGKTTAAPVFYESRHLTTHGVVVGMTGSGKTGLCITAIEEAAIDGIPTILVDPKGDMANLLLTFPDLSPADFLPWVNPEDARRKKMSIDDYAAKVAGDWQKGLADWKMTGERIARLKQSAEFRIYTPGSEIGLPVSLVGNFAAPPKSLPAEDLRSKVTATTSALLGLAGVPGDAVRGKEHIFLSNLLAHCWDKGEDVSLERLIGYIQRPPIRKLGAFDIDAFFPESERQQLAFAVNNILASPAFQSWMIGDPIDFDRMLHCPDGRPRCLIFSIAHLDDDQRMFFATLLLEQLLSWMRAQAGATSLRALLYFDELFGFMPPHPANPPSKQPLLTILKQGRAFGLGALLATQNPVDLDYKALSNAGTWFVGKLQTERDKARLLDGLEGACAAQGSLQDRATLDKTIAGLSTRKFLYHNIHESKPKVIESRWALSYLRGPMSREQIGKLMAPLRAPAEAAPATKTESSRHRDAFGPKHAADAAFKARIHRESGSADPVVAMQGPPHLGRDVVQFYLPIRKRLPAALSEAGVDSTDAVRLLYAPLIVGEGAVRFVDRRRNVDGKLAYLLGADAPAEHAVVDWSSARRLAEADWLAEAEDVADAIAWLEVPTTVNEARDYKPLLRDFERHLYDTAFLALMSNAKLGLVANPGEDRETFLKRCREAAVAKRNEEAEKQRPKLQRRIDQIEEKIRRGAQQLDEREAEYAARRRTETVSVFETMLNMVVGRRSVRGISTASHKRSQSRRAELDVREARDNLDVYRKAMDDLRAEWEELAASLNDKWMEIANDIDEVRITPRKTDIAVPRFGLGWAPHWEIPLAAAVKLVPAY